MKRELRSAGFRGVLTSEATLAQFTTWRIGGPAELLAEPEDREDLLLAIGWARAAGVRWRILGNGSNLLVSDAGVRGLVLRVRKGLAQLLYDGKLLTAGAGAMLSAVAKSAASHGLAGVEFHSGIPGTIGGGILMNAGVPGQELGDRVEEVEYLESDGSLRRYGRRDCRFRYRGSRFSGGKGVVLGARLVLKEDDPAEIRKRIKESAAERRKKQPTALPSCGSVFFNPEGDHAGRLIDEAGLKEKHIGDIEVSAKHANFFINIGEGRSVDVLELVQSVRREVENRFGVLLETEFEYWG
jgi:UDP-N-acetylmuramate dehydrogenase